jgi:hypothetical protein
MTAGNSSGISLIRRPPGRLGVYAPWPLVGVTVLLIALIVFTPVLVSSSSHRPAPGILTQAELVVDKVAGNASFHFYVWALGEEIRYDEIRIGVATSFNWTGAAGLNWSRVNWTEWHNGTDVLSEIVVTAANPVALNISAYYSPFGGAWYVGMIAFYDASGSSPGSESLYSTSNTAGIAVTSPLAVSNDTLPAVILLHSAGGPP